MKPYFLGENYEGPRGADIRTLLELDPLKIQQSFDHASIVEWGEQQRQGAEVDDRMQTLVENLNDLFQFVYCSPDPKHVTARVWAVLYLVRPELIGYESVRSAAERLGMSDEMVRQAVRRFRKRYPSLRLPGLPAGGRIGRGRSQGGLEANRKVQQRLAGVKAHETFDDYVVERAAAVGS